MKGSVVYLHAIMCDCRLCLQARWRSMLEFEQYKANKKLAIENEEANVFSDSEKSAVSS